MRRTATRSRVAAVLAALWWRAFNRPTDTALVPFVEADVELERVARAEVDAITTSTPQWTALTQPSQRTRISLMAITLVTGLLFATLGVTYDPPPTQPRCTFDDGSYVEGECMFVDEFDTFDTVEWQASNDWSGPLQNVVPDVGCFREESVAVSGGNLRLTMSINARASCPTSWTSTAYYATHEYTAGTTYEDTWPLGQATSYDVAVVDMKRFRFKYGRVQMRITMPPGRGPGGDVSLWGIACQLPVGSVGALSQLFTHPEETRDCNWPVNATEMDIIQSSRSGATTIINTSVYTDNATGSPPLVSDFFGINYYGARWAQPATGGFTTWQGGTVSNPTTSYHVYELYWSPTRWSVTVDNVLQAIENPSLPTWIPDGLMYVMFWNAATVAVTEADLPSTMLVDYIRITCPPELNGICEWGNAP